MLVSQKLYLGYLQRYARYHSGTGEIANNNGNLADQVTNAALRYRMQAPLLDSIMKEIGLNLEQGIEGMTAGMSSKVTEK